MKDPRCYADKWFEIECRKSMKPNASAAAARVYERHSPSYKPYLKSIDLEMTFIDVSKGIVGIQNPILSRNCGRSAPSVVELGSASPFAYSQYHNKFVSVGCNTIALLQSNGSGVSGCVSICNNNEDIVGENSDTITDMNIEYGCHGTHCCEASLPLHLTEYNATIQGLNNNASQACSYAMIVTQKNYNNFDDYSYSYISIGDIENLTQVPAVLTWEIRNHMLINSSLNLPADTNVRCFNTDVAFKESGWRCTCKDQFDGNPYVARGCRAISSESYHDSPPPKQIPQKKSRAKSVIVGIFSSLGSIIVLLALWWLYKVVKEKIVKKRKERFFKRNGGLLLEQRLSSGEVNADQVIIFSLRDLEKATDHFNVNRILGKGGQGTVYKGMLIDGRIVAVKKFRVEGNIEEFINEFVILSQINHRNVVKLLGSCLETEIPLLVYEFIPNGNLFEYLHEQNEDLPMTWDMRLRIATEVAGALFYLHSAASLPIYHRDIKSTNILLDEKYKAKVADFGTSRMVSVEATHLTTIVQGTFGYLDPEYFHTSQFTEKSDVYSFGVVLVELLTGQKPISCLRPQEAKSLASYFVLCMEENRLFDVIEERVVKEGEKEHIITIANVASRCLELNGKKRPTMKEVMLELENILKLGRKSNAQENHDELELGGIQDFQTRVAYSHSFQIGQNSITSTLEDMPIRWTT
ncbi:hypothetical protein RJT34_14504 [Clitoria ternatea]|uniref:Protein kinase domain-containing protein n=1 Tax=Clitoria ternatea TaxID=43366 RepID=A0AAN9JU30_CLITE